MDITPIIDQIIFAMMILGTIVGVGVLFFVVLVLAKYKHKVIVKLQTSTGNKIIQVKARDFEEDGVKYWKLQNSQGIKFKLMPQPKSENINLDAKGKLIVEAYYLDTEEWSFCKNGWGKEGDDTFTPAQKNQLIRQIKKNEARKNNSIHDLVAQAMPYLFILMLMVLGVAFYEDMIKPANEMAIEFKEVSANLKATSEHQEQIMKYIKEVIKQEQVLDGKDIGVPETIINEE